MKKRVHRFDSSAEFRAYAMNRPEAIGISPGGAAARLGVSRQRVYQLIDSGDIEAWFVYDREAGPGYDEPHTRASFAYLSEADVQKLMDMERPNGRRRPGPRPKVPEAA